jgi:phosphomannomutase
MRPIPSLKISISGVRGVVGDSLTPAMLTRFAQAFGTWVGGRRVVIGRDPRTSGEMVRQAVLAGLVSSGCRVSDLGLCPTPTVQLMVRQLGAAGGVAITASHNPPQWNALTFVGGDGLFLSAARGRELLDIYHQGDYTKVPGTEQRTPERIENAVTRHVAAVIEGLGRLPEAARPLKVVIDPGGGAASVAAPQLARALGAEVVSIHTTTDGHFPRPAEPVAANLGALAEAVRAEGARVGFAQDMDGDRLAIADEQGRAIGEERTIVLAAEQVLSHTPGPVTVNLATTEAVEAVAERFGCSVTRTRVGEANVAEGMRQSRAVIGGEGNGGVIYPRVNFARDSPVAMALVLHRLAESGRPVAELAAQYDRFHVVKLQRESPPGSARALVERAREEWAGRPLDLRDGVKVRLDQGWFVLRPSNTEPLVRVIAEASSEAAARELAEHVMARLESWRGDLKSAGEKR